MPALSFADWSTQHSKVIDALNDLENDLVSASPNLDDNLDAIEAVKSGQPIPMRDDHASIGAELAECKSAGEVRAVFNRHWPHEAPAQKAPPPPDQRDRLRSEREMQAALTAYFAGLLTRLGKEMG